MSKPHLVDGGYLSWTYGCKEGTQSEWETARVWYSHHRGNLILLDHKFSYRQELDEHYKSRRKQRRELDPEKMATRQRVHDFVISTILTDEKLSTFEWSGLEADDLVALFALSDPEAVNVVGIDKDLLQLPFTSIKLRKINDERVFVSNYARRLPQALQPYVRRGRDVLLCLALMGDKSDSVLRIAPLRDFRQMIELLHHPRPFRQAAQWFGEFEVGRNVYLTVLPGPWVYERPPTPTQVIDQLDDGTWWTWQSDRLQGNLYSTLLDLRESYRHAKKLQG